MRHPDSSPLELPSYLYSKSTESESDLVEQPREINLTLDSADSAEGREKGVRLTRQPLEKMLCNNLHSSNS